MFETFVINLDRHKGRIRFMAAQLEALGVPFTRFPAVNGYEPAEIAKADVAPFAPLSGGEIGCWESHRRIWREIVDRGLPGAFVLEDDMVLASDFGRLDFPPRLLSKGDVIKLDSFRRPASYGAEQVEVGKGRHVQRLLGDERSTGAYFITAKGAERLHARSRAYFMAIDEVMFRRASRIFWELEVWKIVPSVAVQARFEVAPEALPADIEDAIQTRLFKTGTDSRPRMGWFRQSRLKLRRLADLDTEMLRSRRARRRLAAFEASGGIVTAQPDFVTPDRAHIERAMAETD